MAIKQRQTLIPKSWARAGLLLMLAFAATNLQAQGTEKGRSHKAYNQELRTNTWSIYAVGGLSWAAGVWYPNIDARQSYKLSPAVGGGIDLTLRPWVRVGAEYLWSRYRREQHPATLSAEAMPMKAYGNYLMNMHNAKLGIGFNAMQLAPSRKAQWLNIWLGTGVGYTLARGNEYAILVNNTLTQGGTSTPITSGANIGSDASTTVTGSVQTTNRHERFNKFYIPTSLHIEADVSRQFTIGLKGEADWFVNRGDIAPKHTTYALASLRYNFVPGKAKAIKAMYEDELATLNEQTNALRTQANEAKGTAQREAALRQQAEQQRDEALRSLRQCEAKQPQPAATAATATQHYVQFAHNSSYFSHDEAERLKEFAQSVKGKKLMIVAEATATGSDDYNLTLSQRRLDRVVELLVAEGFAEADLQPQTAIGARNGKITADGRRVTISIGQ